LDFHSPPASDKSESYNHGHLITTMLCAIY
jgi:hypothetical protein